MLSIQMAYNRTAGPNARQGFQRGNLRRGGSLATTALTVS